MALVGDSLQPSSPSYSQSTQVTSTLDGLRKSPSPVHSSERVARPASPNAESGAVHTASGNKGTDRALGESEVADHLPSEQVLKELSNAPIDNVNAPTTSSGQTAELPGSASTKATDVITHPSWVQSTTTPSVVHQTVYTSSDSDRTTRQGSSRGAVTGARSERSLGQPSLTRRYNDRVASTPPRKGSAVASSSGYSSPYVAVGESQQEGQTMPAGGPQDIHMQGTVSPRTGNAQGVDDNNNDSLQLPWGQAISNDTGSKEEISNNTVAASHSLPSKPLHDSSASGQEAGLIGQSSTSSGRDQGSDRNHHDNARMSRTLQITDHTNNGGRPTVLLGSTDTVPANPIGTNSQTDRGSISRTPASSSAQPPDIAGSASGPPEHGNAPGNSDQSNRRAASQSGDGPQPSAADDATIRHLGQMVVDYRVCYGQFKQARQEEDKHLGEYAALEQSVSTQQAALREMQHRMRALQDEMKEKEGRLKKERKLSEHKAVLVQKARSRAETLKKQSDEIRRHLGIDDQQEVGDRQK